MKISSLPPQAPPPGKLQPSHSLPPDLKQRADAFLHNENVYTFPALSKVVQGPPEQVNFERVWSLAANPEHWGDDSYHKIVDLEHPGQGQSREGAWFTMTHRGFPLMPTVLGKQPFAGVIVESSVKGEPGQRVGTVSLVELNTSGKSSWRAIPEHIQTLTVRERKDGEVGLTIGVRTAPSSSPPWLRKGFLIPWGRWHIQTDEADKLRTFQQRMFPDQPPQANPVERGRNLGALVGGVVGCAALSGGGLGAALAGTLVGALGGAGVGYYLAAEKLKNEADPG